MAHQMHAAATPPTVLVVDDESGIRETLTMLLEEEGFRVLQAPDGGQALEIAAREAPGVILSDICMPVLDGYGLLAAVREDRALDHIPVLLMSANGAATPPGMAVPVIAKPFDSDQVVVMIRAALAAGPPPPSADR